MQKDKRTGRPKIWLYLDKVSNEPKGDATVTYEDPHAALAAVEWFNNKEFHGNIIGVFIAESKNKDNYSGGAARGGSTVLVGNVSRVEEDADVNGSGELDKVSGDVTAKPWQKDGDWACPNTRSVCEIGEKLIRTLLCALLVGVFIFT